MTDAKTLLRMKEKVEKAKTDLAESEGEIKSLTKRLKDDFDCKDEKAGAALLKELGQQIEDLEEKIETEVAALEEKYDWS